MSVRWGLLGASDIAATRVVPAMRAAGHVVAGVCSGSAARAADYAIRHDIPVGTDELDRLLGADIDAVYISSRNGEHAGQAQAAAAAGKHVLCEKPLATTFADAQKTVDACAAAGVVLAVNHHLPGAGTHRRVREMVASGAVGRPLSAAVRHAVLLPERLRGWRLFGRAGRRRHPRHHRPRRLGAQPAHRRTGPRGQRRRRPAGRVGRGQRGRRHGRHPLRRRGPGTDPRRLHLRLHRPRGSRCTAMPGASSRTAS